VECISEATKSKIINTLGQRKLMAWYITVPNLLSLTPIWAPLQLSRERQPNRQQTTRL